MLGMEMLIKLSIISDTTRYKYIARDITIQGDSFALFKNFWELLHHEKCMTKKLLVQIYCNF